jgi:hypothetical protein
MGKAEEHESRANQHIVNGTRLARSTIRTGIASDAGGLGSFYHDERVI